MMRITTQMLNGNPLGSTNKIQERIMEIREQISSGRKISTPGQDPLGATRISSFDVQIAKLEDWNKNVNAAKDEAKMSYDMLGLMHDELLAINALAIQASDGATSKETMDSLKLEVEGRMKTLVNYANTQYDGVYLYAGTNLGSAPYTLNDDMTVTYNGTEVTGDWKRKAVIAQGEETTLNTLGAEVFGDGTGGMFATLKDMYDAISTDPPDHEAVRAQLENMQTDLKTVAGAMSKASSTVTKLDITKELNDTTLLNLTQSRSEIRDTDVIEASTELLMQQTMLEASYKVTSAMLNKPSLLNYL